MDTTQFWCVWCPTGYTPTKKHPTAHAARSEAERLAEQNPGKEFFVLEATGVAQVQKPVTFKAIGPCPF